MTSFSENPSQLIIQGGLQNVIFACRSEDEDAAKLAILSLANMLYHAGGNYQKEMVRQQILEWLFIPAVHTKEVIQYYTLLTVTLILTNQ